VAEPSIAFAGVPVGDALATHPVRDSAVSPDRRCSTLPSAGPAVTGPLSVRDACRHAPAVANMIDREIQHRRPFTITGPPGLRSPL